MFISIDLFMWGNYMWGNYLLLYNILEQLFFFSIFSNICEIKKKYINDLFIYNKYNAFVIS